MTDRAAGGWEPVTGVAVYTDVYLDPEAAMSRLLTRFCIPLLALPLTALADTVTVTTYASGSIEPNPGAVYHLGMDLYGERNGPVPYDLTLSSTFDPDVGSIDSGDSDWFGNADVAVQLRIGTARYRYDNTLHTTTRLRVFDGGDAYEQEIGLIPGGTPGLVTYMSNRLDAPVGSGGLFAPRTVAPGAGQGVTTIFTFLDDPEAPYLTWEMSAEADSMSLQITSAVPAPAPTDALLVGLGTICLWGRRRRSH